MRKLITLLMVGLLGAVVAGTAMAKHHHRLSATHHRRPTANGTPDPTQTFSATDDSYVDSSHPNTNYGSSRRLWIKSSSPVRRTYLKFNVSLPAGSIITGATLKLFVATRSNVAGFDVYGESNTSWTESGITYNNAPAFDSKLGNSGPWSSGDVYLAFPMPADSIVPGLNSIGVARPSTISSAVGFYSRQGGEPPLLIVDYTPPTSPSDTTPPTVPAGLMATAGDQQTKLQWTASTDPDSPVAGYYVFRNGAEIATVSGTSYTDTGLTDGTTYSYDVEAFDPSGNVSGPSSVVTVTPQAPPPPPPSGVPAGRYIFDDSSASAADGFTIMDVSSKAEADATPSGTTGLIWIGQYNNSTCSFDLSDSQVTSVVSGNAGDPKIAGYFLADEPDPNACPNAISQMSARNQLVKSLDTDPTHHTFMTIDSNSGSATLAQIPKWKGVTDYQFLDPYPCTASGCDFSWVSQVISAADSAGLSYWGVVQAFQADSWVYPTASQLTQLLNLWESSHEVGIAAFAWTYNGNSLTSHPDLLSVFKSNFSGSPPPPSDTTPPSTPTGLASSSATATSISVGWTASTDPDSPVAGYDLYQNGINVGTTTSTSHTFSGLTCGTSYTIAVDAFDPSGNVSGQDSVTASTAACPDTAPPPVPTGLAATPGNAQVALKWNASVDPDGDSVSYNVYRDGTKVASSSATGYTDTGLTNGTAYRYQVSAVDSHSNESALSGAVSATPQAPSGSPPHIMVIMMENHSAGAVIGNSSAPFQNSLATKYTSLTNWFSVDHPSAPNYVAWVSGQDNGQAGAGDCSPSIGSSCDYSGDNLGNQLFAAGIPMAWFAEDLSGNGCSIANSESGNNDVNHEPWAYMDKWQATAGACAEAGLTTTSPSDPQVISALNSASPPDFVWVTPNLTDDTHNGTVAQGDTYLQNLVTAVRGTSWYAQGGTILITYDESEGTSPPEGGPNPTGYCTVAPAGSDSECIPTFIISAKDANVGLVSTSGNHYGTLRSLEECYSLPLLGNAAAVNSSGQATYGDIKNRLC